MSQIRRVSFPDAAFVALVSAVCVTTFGPVFGGFPGYFAAGGGAVLGLIIGVLGYWRGWTIFPSVFIITLSYLLFVGVFALPDTTIAGFIPSWETVTRGSLLIVQSWRDLLTVAVPASSFSGPAVVPFLTGLVCVNLAGRISQTAHHYRWSVLPLGVFLLVGILWGIIRTPYGLWAGVLFSALTIAWLGYRHSANERRVQKELGITTQHLGGWRRVLAALVVLAISVATALGLAPKIATINDRFVLRQIVEPPLDLRNYASPLMSYRYYEVDQKDAVLFRVHGMPDGSRIRLATLDVYDGMVYNVSEGSADFVRAGAEIEPRHDELRLSTGGDSTTLSFTVEDYAGFWLPGGGDLRGVSFAGPDADGLARGLYFNDATGTALVTPGINKSDSYTVNVVLPQAVDKTALGEHGIRQVRLPGNSRVPDAVLKKTAEIVGEETDPLSQVLAIETALQQGYYSDGTDGKSLSGHSNARITTMLEANQLIGDDEQYSVAMALMLRYLGIPARVVMGFYPTQGATPEPDWEAKGTDAHVWVEVPFNEVGWVAFDPTPDRDRRPETVTPKPEPKPRPQVPPPPLPPQEPLEIPERLGEEEEEPEENGINWALVLLLVKIAGISGLIMSPFLALALVRRIRRHRRRSALNAADRLTGGWAEVIDAATDLGISTNLNNTRREQAAELATCVKDADFLAVASAVDYGVFGDGNPRDEFISSVWNGADELKSAMHRGVSRWRQLLFFGSVISLLKPARTGMVRKKQWRSIFSALRSRMSGDLKKDSNRARVPQTRHDPADPPPARSLKE